MANAFETGARKVIPAVLVYAFCGKRVLLIHRVPPEHLALWVGQLGWEALLNRRGTTWRKLPPGEQARVQDAASAMALMQAHPSVIKRPVAEWPQGGPPRATVGFDAALWAEWAKA